MPPILQKGRTTVEWAWWRHRNATPKIFCTGGPKLL